MANEDLLMRQMPHSLDGERAVLGSMMVDPKCIKEVMDKLRAEDFYLKPNRDIFETIQAMFSFAKPIDGIMVYNEMEKAGLCDENTRSYLAQIIDLTLTTTNAAGYAEIVRDKALLRTLAQAASEVLNMVMEGIGNPDGGGAENLRRAPGAKRPGDGPHPDRPPRRPGPPQ